MNENDPKFLRNWANTLAMCWLIFKLITSLFISNFGLIENSQSTITFSAQEIITESKVSSFLESTNGDIITIYIYILDTKELNELESLGLTLIDSYNVLGLQVVYHFKFEPKTYI